MALRCALLLAAVSAALAAADPVTDALASTACSHGNQLTWTSHAVGAFLRDAGFSEAVRVEAAELGLTGERLAELVNLDATRRRLTSGASASCAPRSKWDVAAWPPRSSSARTAWRAFRQ